MTRIDQLRKFIADDPNDPFLLYALALEYLRDEPGKASAVFSQLLSGFPDYVPTYYPAAHLCIDQGQTKEAERLFKLGIDHARRQGDRKTEQELRRAFDQWLFERQG